MCLKEVRRLQKTIRRCVLLSKAEKAPLIPKALSHSKGDAKVKDVNPKDCMIMKTICMGILILGFLILSAGNAFEVILYIA
jgi:hypothetical protein